MNEEYCYVSLLYSDDFTLGIIGLNYSLQKTNPKYPFLVLVTDNVSKKSLKMLDEDNIAYKRIKNYFFINDKINSYFSSTLNKFQIFDLQYKKICFLDADIIIRKNIDNFFSYPSFSAEYLENNKKNPIKGGVLIFELPFLYDFNYIKNKYQKICENDEDVLSYLKNKLQYKMTKNDLKNIIHDGGKPKYWIYLENNKNVHNFLDKYPYYYKKFF